MPRKRKRDIDLSIHPENKYKGILYTADRKRASDDELPHSVRTRTGRARQQKAGKLESLFGSVSLFHVKRGKDSSIKPSRHARAAAKNLTPAAAPAPTGGGRVLRSSKNSGGNGFFGFFRDHMIRTTCLICCAVVAVSLITVQTTLAKPGTSITLIDNGREMQCETLTQTVGDFLEENGVDLHEEDVISTDKDVPIYEGQVITIYRAVPITVRSNGQNIDVNIVAGHTVQDALDKAGIVPAEYDEVYPSTDTIVRSGMVIDHIVVTTGQTTEQKPIGFENKTRENSQLPKGETQVVQAGQEGVLQITYTQLYKNGVLISQDSVSEDVIQQPVDQIMEIGTYVKPEPKPEPKKKTTSSSSSSKKNNSSSSSNKGNSSSGGSSNTDLNGKQGRKFQLTAYCSACNSGSKTSSGTYPVAGRTVACNSLPLGTRIMIEGFGEYVVEDRGGMGGNVIDIYLGDRDTCTCGADFGRKPGITVYVL